MIGKNARADVCVKMKDTILLREQQQKKISSKVHTKAPGGFFLILFIHLSSIDFFSVV